MTIPTIYKLRIDLLDSYDSVEVVRCHHERIFLGLIDALEMAKIKINPFSHLKNGSPITVTITPKTVRQYAIILSTIASWHQYNEDFAITSIHL